MQLASINSVRSFKPLIADYKDEYNVYEYYVELVILMVQRSMKIGAGPSVDYLMNAVSLAAYCKSEIESERTRGVIYNLQDHIIHTANKLTRNGRF